MNQSADTFPNTPSRSSATIKSLPTIEFGDVGLNKSLYGENEIAEASQRWGELCFLPAEHSIQDMDAILEGNLTDQEVVMTFGIEAKRIPLLKRKLEWIKLMTGVDSLRDLSPDFLINKEVIGDIRNRVLASLRVPRQKFEKINKIINDQVALRADIQDAEKLFPPTEDGQVNSILKRLKDQYEEQQKELEHILQPRALRFERHAADVRSIMGEITKKFLDLSPEQVLNDIARFCDDPGKLLVRSLLAKDTKERYEYDLRLELIWLKNIIEREVGSRKKEMALFTEALGDYAFNSIPEQIYNQEGEVVEKMVNFKNLYLLSHHNPENENDCVGCDVLESEPLNLKEGQYLEKIPCRAIQVPEDVKIPKEAEVGKDRMIYFMVLLDQKSDSSQLIKAIRKPGGNLNEAIRDLNRGRMVFQNKAQRELALDIIEGRIPHPIRRDNVKETVGGKNGRKSVPCYKFNWLMEVDGKTHDCEMHCLNSWEDYMDYMLSKKHAWCLYEIKRFYEDGVYEKLFAYEDYDSEAKMETAMELVYSQEVAKRRKQVRRIMVQPK